MKIFYNNFLQFIIIFYFVRPTISTNLSAALEPIFLSYRNTLDYLRNGYQDPITQDVTVWCKWHSGQHFIQVLMYDPNVTEKIQTYRPIIFIVHGYISSKETPWVQNMANDIITYTDSNVCIIDWTKRANIIYQIAVLNCPVVGQFIGEFIETTIQPFVYLKDISLVGHSMGAHIAGHAGNHLNGQLGAIYGLDPAGPLFTFPRILNKDYRLDSSDANFVQILHTTAFTVGTAINSGHQDFWLNSGMSPQPNCLFQFTSDIISCSHTFSAEIFRLSLNPSNKYRTVGNEDIYGYYSSRIPGQYLCLTSIFTPYTWSE